MTFGIDHVHVKSLQYSKVWFEKMNLKRMIFFHWSSLLIFGWLSHIWRGCSLYKQDKLYDGKTRWLDSSTHVIMSNPTQWWWWRWWWRRWWRRWWWWQWTQFFQASSNLSISISARLKAPGVCWFVSILVIFYWHIGGGPIFHWHIGSAVSYICADTSLTNYWHLLGPE